MNPLGSATVHRSLVHVGESETVTDLQILGGLRPDPWGSYSALQTSQPLLREGEGEEEEGKG